MSGIDTDVMVGGAYWRIGDPPIVPKAAAQHNQAAAKVDKPALYQQELLNSLRSTEKRLERVEKHHNQGNVNNNQSSDRDRSQRGRRWFQNRHNNSGDFKGDGNEHSQ